MASKYHGVVEGFYRKPYTFSQRHDLVRFLADLGMNTYVYAPKNDPFHRRRWFEPYPGGFLKKFERLNEHCIRHHINFNFALSPLEDPDCDRIIGKVKPLMKLGISHFSLFFDDISVPLTRVTAERQIKAAHAFLRFLRDEVPDPVLFFCPTQYRGFKKTAYLDILREQLDKNIHVFWTGRRVVSFRITGDDVMRFNRLLGRAPLIWDNIFANDYIPGIILRMPYRYREPAIVEQSAGILINPMNHYQCSKPLIFTVAQFIKDPHHYVPKRAWRDAIRRCVIG